ncbi:MAG: hypothetical protein ACODAB_09400 [Gemmatimonadota bacterium]
MRKFTMALAAAALALAAPASISAQDLSAVCNHMQQAEAGDWAEYATESPQGSGTLRFAMLPEGASGDAGQWLEMAGEFNGQTSVVQVLVDNYPHTPGDISAVVMKQGEQPAQQLPESMITQVANQIATPVSGIAAVCAESEVVGNEALDVPAGSFDAVQIRPPTADAQADTLNTQVWVSTNATFGLVRTESTLGSITLTDMGSGATSSISETPTEMQPASPGGGGTP